MNEHIAIGLKDLIQVIEPKDYRILGSLIPASLENPYRKINDIDVIANEDVQKQVTKELELRGYRVSKVRGFGNLLGITPTRFSKMNIKIDVVWGQVENNCWKKKLILGFSLYIPPSVWKKHKTYSFNGASFPGAPVEFAYMMIYNYTGMKDRSKDVEILLNHIDKGVIDKITNEKPGVYFLGLYLPIDKVGRYVWSAVQQLERPFTAK